MSFVLAERPTDPRLFQEMMVRLVMGIFRTEDRDSDPIEDAAEEILEICTAGGIFDLDVFRDAIRPFLHDFLDRVVDEIHEKMVELASKNRSEEGGADSSATQS